MIFRKLAFTFTGVFLFILAFSYQEVLFHAGNVSHETLQPESFAVKQGVTHDGAFAVMRTVRVPGVPQNIMISNPARTLRAFIAPNRAGISVVHIDAARPRETHSVSSAYLATEQNGLLQWSDNSTLMFYATTREGRNVKVHLNFETLNSSVEYIELGK